MMASWIGDEPRGTTPVPTVKDTADRPARSVPRPQTQDDPHAQGSAKTTAQAVLPPDERQTFTGRGESTMIQTKSAIMAAVLTTAEGQAKRSARPILVMGETGTGKTTLARMIHAWTGRTGPFVRVNCASLSETLGESELFGHARYAFTDAKEAKRGRVTEAEGGTLFLDEIGELSLGLQKKILDLLDVSTYRPLGSGAKEMTADVRIVVATHRDLEAMVREGTFREDLLMRLRLRLVMPSLRDRREDMLDIIAEICRAERYEDRKSVV